MIIRPVQDQDYPQIAKLREDTIKDINSADYPETVILDWISQNSEEKLRRDAHKYQRWVAVEGDKVIGFCDRGLGCELARLYVHKDHLRKGVGGQLITVAEQSLRESGCKKITVKSTITAKPFYKSQGYKFIKEIVEDGVPAYLLEKELKLR